MLGTNSVYESYKSEWKWIKIRFPFSKKDIVALEKIVRKSHEYYHKNGSHEHYFRFTALNAYRIYNALLNRNFVTDNIIVELYDKVSKILSNQMQYIPVLDQTTLYNVNEN